MLRKSPVFLAILLISSWVTPPGANAAGPKRASTKKSKPASKAKSKGKTQSARGRGSASKARVSTRSKGRTVYRRHAGKPKAASPKYRVRYAPKSKAPRAQPPAKKVSASPNQRYRKSGVVAVRTRLNLRSGPGTNFPVLGKLGPGAKVATSERSRNTMTRPDRSGQHRWYKVRVGNREGWVWGGYLSLGGQSPRDRGWRRTPSATPAEAKQKRRVNLPAKMIDDLKARYKRRLNTRPPGTWTKARSELGQRGPVSQPKKPIAQQTPRQTPQQTPTATPGKPTTLPPKAPKKPGPAPSVGQTSQTSAPIGKGGKLDVSKLTPFSQGDPRWASTTVGKSENRTMKQVGCAVTSWSMLLQFYGKNLPPDRLNAALNKLNGFDGASLNMSAVGQLVGKRVVDTRNLGKGWAENQDLAMNAIHKNFASANPKPMLMQVDYNSDADKAGNHFVLVTGMSPKGDPIIFDPGDSKNRGVPLSQVVSHGGYVPLRALSLE